MNKAQVLTAEDSCPKLRSADAREARYKAFRVLFFVFSADSRVRDMFLLYALPALVKRRELRYNKRGLKNKAASEGCGWDDHFLVLLY